MFRSPLHSSGLVGMVKAPSLARRQAHNPYFPPIREKESYEKNASTLFTLFGFIVF